MDDHEAILREYKTQAKSAAWPTAAAQDSRLETASLFALAVRDHSLAEGDAGTSALLVLQQRCDDLTAAFLKASLRGQTPMERIIAARVMREFPRLDFAPTRHSRGFLDAIWAAALQEQDTEALAELLRAAAWQRLENAQALLLRFRRDPRVEVRGAVAGNLLVASNGKSLSDDVMDALIAFASDDSDWIAGGVLYDVASFPELFASKAQSFLNIAAGAKEAADEDLRRWATAVVDVFANH